MFCLNISIVSGIGRLDGVRCTTGIIHPSVTIIGKFCALLQLSWRGCVCWMSLKLTRESRSKAIRQFGFIPFDIIVEDFFSSSSSSSSSTRWWWWWSHKRLLWSLHRVVVLLWPQLSRLVLTFVGLFLLSCTRLWIAMGSLLSVISLPPLCLHASIFHLEVPFCLPKKTLRVGWKSGWSSTLFFMFSHRFLSVISKNRSLDFTFTFCSCNFSSLDWFVSIKVCIPPEEEALASKACENTLLFVCLFGFCVQSNRKRDQ